MDQHRFNIRVYGVLQNDQGQVLLVHEQRGDFKFTKFPGGGLEWGEGIADCLVREFKEETGLNIEISRHLYTTDFFQQSAFKKNDQLVSVYYLVNSAEWHSVRLDQHEVRNNGVTEHLRFEWVNRNQLNEGMLTFPVDQFVCGMLRSLPEQA